jgi:2,3-bisphosphoglycerate-dependent phosphoglycerate mutase
MMHDAGNGDDSVMIVGHGVTNRAFEMNFLHHSVDWFERSDNPGNADIVLLEKEPGEGYTSILFHQAGDRRAGQESQLRDAYGAEMKIAPRHGEP